MSMREEFEVAFMADIVERHGQFSADQDGWLDRNSNGEYRSFRTNGAWWGWQASRELLVIDLPIDVTGGHYRLAVESCKRCIEAAGIKVKP